MGVANTSSTKKRATLDIEKEYQKRIRAMSPKEKMARSVAMTAWARQTMARQIRAELGPEVSDERIKWLVAMKIYGSNPGARILVQRMLNRVPN